MKKNKFLVFYTIFASIIFVVSLVFLGYNLYTEYSHGPERTKRRFEHMTNSIQKICQTQYSSVNNFKTDLNKAVGDLSDFSFLKIQENNRNIFIYPESNAVSNTDSKLISNYNFSFSINEIKYSVSADLYTLRPYSIYYYSRISFLIIIIITIITAILIIYYNVSDKSAKQSLIESKESDESESNTETQSEETSEEIIDESNLETSESEITEVDSFDEKTDELNNNEIAIFETSDDSTIKKEKISLPSEDFEPVKIETLPSEEPESPSGLFSPTTGLGWESYLITRLDNELNRAISSEFDLSLFEFKIPGIKRDNPKIKQIADFLISQFQFKDLIFEYKEDSIVAIKINMILDDALSFADKLYVEIVNILDQSSKCYIGITTRTIRMIASDRLLLEADEAIVHAQENPENPIIAFRANAEKYRQFLENK